MRTPFTLLSALFALCLLSPVFSQTPSKTPETKLNTRAVLPEKYATPEDAVKTFLTALRDNNFNVAWESLSTRSQESFVKSYAGKSRSAQSRVRDLFRKSDDEIQKNFWTPLRDRSKILPYVPGATYKVADNKQGLAMIEMSSGGVTRHLTAVLEGTEWRMGYVESNLE